MLFNIQTKFKCSKSTTHQHPIPLHVETLEQRQLLAGDVSLTIVGDTLFVEGDADANRIEFVSDGSIFIASGQGTTLNGQSESLLFFDIDVISADLGDGNDRITLVSQNNLAGSSFLGNSIFAGEISINGGAGNDQITLIAENTDGAGFNANIEIDSGAGNDRIQLLADNSGTVGFSAELISVATGDGNDRVEFGASNSGAIGFFTENLGVQTGDDRDQVNFVAENTGASVGFLIGDPTGSGFIADFWAIETGGGDDRITVEAQNEGQGIGFSVTNFAFVSGAGRDRITVEAESSGGGSGFLVNNTGAIFSEAGDDRVAITAKNTGGDTDSFGFEMKKLTIDTGAGKDRLDLVAQNQSGVGFKIGDGLFANNGLLSINTGTEDDRITIRARNRAGVDGSIAFAMNQFELHAGDGNDRLQIRADNRDNLTVGFLVFENLNADLGAGKDSVQLSTREEYGIQLPIGETLFDGGTGNQDQLRLSGLDNFDATAQINFEES